MKKNQIFVSAVFAMLCVGACQEKTMDTVSEEVAVNVSVSLPAEQTKAMSEADLVDIVYYEVWNSDMTVRLIPAAGEEPVSAPVIGKTATLSLTLVSSQTYNFIFWAQKKAVENGFKSPYSWDNLKDVKVDYNLFTENNKDCYDAFYAVKDIVADGKSKSVDLYRPFAQLNFGASTMVTSVGEFTVEKNVVTVTNVSKSFNTVSGKASSTDVASVRFEATSGGLVQEETADSKDLKVADKSYYWVSMNYLLVAAGYEDNVEVVAQFYTTGGLVEHSIGSVPVQKNFRTNIVGDIFTNTSEFTITVVPDFLTPDKEVSLN
jgi:hypothetical protein